MQLLYCPEESQWCEPPAGQSGAAEWTPPSPRKESLTTHPSQDLNQCDGVRKCPGMCNRTTQWSTAPGQVGDREVLQRFHKRNPTPGMGLACLLSHVSPCGHKDARTFSKSISPRKLPCQLLKGHKQSPLGQPSQTWGPGQSVPATGRALPHRCSCPGTA